jgi:hypothetical protein
LNLFAKGGKTLSLSVPSISVGARDLMVFITIQVPPNVEAGIDTLIFEYGGNELEILVPPDSVAGDVLQIQVGGVNDCDGDDERVNNDETSSLLSPASSSISLLNELGGTTMDGPSRTEEDNLSSGLKQRITTSCNCETDGVLNVKLGDGGILHIYDSINNNQKIMSSSNNDDGDGGEDGTNTMIWAAGRVLAQALTSTFGMQLLNDLLLTPSTTNAPINACTSNPTSYGRYNQINCLELGSGLGVCGLALAHALNTLCYRIGNTDDSDDNNNHPIIANILLTDRGEDTLHILRKNILSNTANDNDHYTTIAAESLVWGNISMQNNNSNNNCDNTTKNNLIIGSDLLYNTQESYIPLLNTIQQHLCLRHGIVLLAVRWRKPDLECQFFKLAESNYGLLFELWDEFTSDTTFGKRRCPCLLHWKEYGNPKSEFLHTFFTETKVYAGGEELSLGQVTEKDMEIMNDEEYTIFEEIQIQIYIGRYDEAKTTISQKRQRKGV